MTGMGSGLTWGSSVMTWTEGRKRWALTILNRVRGKIAFCFPGQGSLEAGMGREIAEAIPEAMAVYERGSESCGSRPAQALLLEPGRGHGRHGDPAAGSDRNQPGDSGRARVARLQARLRRRPLGGRVRRPVSRQGDRSRGRDRAGARARAGDGRGCEGAPRLDGGDPRPRRRDRRESSAARSTASGRRTTTARARSSSPARPTRSRSAARRPSAKARAGR